MNVLETSLPGVLLVQPKVFTDPRGFFIETYNQRRYRDAGIAATFVQDNLSSSSQGTLRGLHFQNPNSQGKLVSVLQGEVFDVAVDIRPESPHFGQWVGVTLSSVNHHQLFVPPGFAHGFCVTSEHAVFVYKCTDFYNPAAEAGIKWNDPYLRINWPITAPILSDRDAQLPPLKDVPPDRLPTYG